MLDLITVFGRDTIPGYLMCNVDLAWAERLMTKFAEQGIRVTITALLIKAIALAQKVHPVSRSIVLPWGRVLSVPHITAGFTVERIINDQPIVYFGIINHPVEKSIAQIAAELREYRWAELDRVPQLAAEEFFTKMPWLVRQAMLLVAKCIPAARFQWFGATFGLSSLGKYGARWVTGPCVCTATFGVGAAEQRPVVDNKAVVIKPMLTLTLGFDQRVMDDRSAQKFLLEVRKLVEGGMEGELKLS